MKAKKIIQGKFKPVVMTREEFVNRWANTVSEAYHLCETQKELDELDSFKEVVGGLAGRRWDHLPTTTDDPADTAG